MSCTSSPETDDVVEEDAGPIDEDEIGEIAEGGDETGEIDEVEGEELDEPVAEELEDVGQEPAEEVAQAAPEGDEDLEAEFEQEDGEDLAAAEDGELAELDELDAETDAEEPPPAELAESEPVESEPIPAPAIIEEAPERARIRDIRYMANSSGGTVVIETTKPVTYQTRMNPATQQFVIEIADAELPTALQRPYNTRDFNSRIGGINAYQGEGSKTARVVIQLAGGGGGEPVVQQEGTSLVVIPPAAPMVAQTPAPAPAKKSGESEGALSARTLDEFLTGNQKFFGRLISLQVKDADVRDVVNFLAEESGANIVMSDDVAGNISLKLRRVPWDQALVTVMRSKGLGYVRQGNVLRISTLRALQAETEASNRIIEAQKAIVPAIVQVIPISYASLEDLIKSVTPFLSKEGKVVADNRTSTLIVTDKAESVDRVQKLVKTLDIPPAQVSIESKIVEAVEEFSRFVGINWGWTGNPQTLSPGGGADGAPVDLTLGVSSATLSRQFQGAAPFNANLTVGALDFFGDLTASLTLAERDSLARVISAPRISTINREKSTIKQTGENVTIVSTRNEQTDRVTKQVNRSPFELELSVTPQITADGSVIMDLDVKREFVGAVVDEETKARPINKRSAKTKVLVRNGQTAVIGGIYTSEEFDSENGIPGLKNIPVLGWLFKNSARERNKNELLIFLTPRILAQEVASNQTASLGN